MSIFRAAGSGGRATTEDWTGRVGVGEANKRIRLGFGALDGVCGMCGVTGTDLKRAPLGVGVVRSKVQLSYRFRESDV